MLQQVWQATGGVPDCLHRLHEGARSALGLCCTGHCACAPMHVPSMCPFCGEVQHAGLTRAMLLLLVMSAQSSCAALSKALSCTCTCPAPPMRLCWRHGSFRAGPFLLLELSWRPCHVACLMLKLRHQHSCWCFEGPAFSLRLGYRHHLVLISSIQHLVSPCAALVKSGSGPHGVTPGSCVPKTGCA